MHIKRMENALQENYILVKWEHEIAEIAAREGPST